MNKEVAQALDYALSRGFQIHPGALRMLEELDPGKLARTIKDVIRKNTRERRYLINSGDLEGVLGICKESELRYDYEVIFDPTPAVTSAEGISGYNALFASRFEKMKRIMSERPEAKTVRTMASLTSAKPEGDVFVWGLVTEVAASGPVLKIRMDDPTGSIELAVFDEDLRKKAGSLLNDQFVMVRVTASKRGGHIAKEIILPDVPEHRAGRAQTQSYAVFISDLHVGSKYFLEKEFGGFIGWLSSSDPVARRVAFVVIGGDIVDGVGIYRDQDKELTHLTVSAQLEKAAELISGIPERIKVFVVPGNHDPGRRALPQPAIPEKYCQRLWEMPNVVMLGNPARISLNGVNVTIFHGQSIDDVVKTTPGLNYGKPAAVMRHLLRARHMSPIFGSQTPIAPETEDMMVMDKVPDIFHVGHVHVIGLEMYRGVLLLNSGAWQGQTPFQVSVGQVPTAGVAVVVDLSNLNVNVRDFSENILKDGIARKG